MITILDEFDLLSDFSNDHQLLNTWTPYSNPSIGIPANRLISISVNFFR